MVDILILFQDDAEEIATRIAWAAAERGYSVWGDPNHFASAPDEEIEAAAKGAKAVALIWSSRMIEEADRRSAAFGAIDPRRTAAAVLQLGLEPPEPWRDRPNFDLSRAEIEADLVEGFVEQLARSAGSPSGAGGAEAVDRLRAAEEEAASWRAIRDLNTPEVFEAYLDRFGKKGLFASLARKRRVAARASRIAAGDETGGASVGSQNLMIWAGAGALAASVAFGLLALVTGGDLRKLSGQPTEDVLALQSAAEYSADLDEQLIKTQETLDAMQEALDARNQAVTELEIALAEARGGEVSTAGEGLRLAEMAERQATLEKELGRKEDALAAASQRLTEAEAALEQARSAAAEVSSPASDDEALQSELEASRKETRRANRILEAARIRIEALESERAALREQAQAAQQTAEDAAEQEAATAAAATSEAEQAVAATASAEAPRSAEQEASTITASPSRETSVSTPQIVASEVATTVRGAVENAAEPSREPVQTPLAATLSTEAPAYTAAPVLRPRPNR